LPSACARENLWPVSTSIWFWVAFHIGVFIALIVDLAQFKHRDRALSMRAAARRTIVWIALSLLFNLLVWKLRDADTALDFLTGYLIEYSLSVDNIFVFVLIFEYFRVPPIAQHRVLVWGIVGALVMRGIMICLGVALVARFHFVLYLFGIFLVITGIRMFFEKHGEPKFEQSLVMRLVRRFVPVSNEFHGQDFATKIDNRWVLTPLALVLILIDVMDLIFAVDSIPAVFAITHDAFIVYTSNICAILGLRSLYFLLANMMGRFAYLRTGLAIVLTFVGAKMIVARYVHLPTLISLAVIVAILGVTITASMIATRNQAAGQRRK
jgi:tellurite resistance protein TerC